MKASISKKDQEYALATFNEVFGGSEYGFAFNYDNDLEQWEIILMDTNWNGPLEIDSNEFEAMNLAGFIYTGHQRDVDYDDSDGDNDMKYMDIAYFKYVEFI